MLVALGISNLSAVSAYASTTYVVDGTSASCSDTGQGSASQPFCTIAAAAKKAQPGDTVLVKRRYIRRRPAVNPANSGTAASPITFTANPGVTVSGGTKAFSLSSRELHRHLRVHDHRHVIGRDLDLERRRRHDRS